MALKKLNPEGTLLQSSNGDVRLERGLDTPDRDSKIVWILFKRVDVKADEETTYEYRFDEVDRFDETDPGEAPEKALKAAGDLA